MSFLNINLEWIKMTIRKKSSWQKLKIYYWFCQVNKVTINQGQEKKVILFVYDVIPGARYRYCVCEEQRENLESHPTINFAEKDWEARVRDSSALLEDLWSNWRWENFIGHSSSFAAEICYAFFKNSREKKNYICNSLTFHDLHLR